jgi:hypothetical protein
MKNNHIHLKRLAAISFVLMLCLSVVPFMAPSASAAEPIAVSNERIGDRVVFQQDYTTQYYVPSNVWLGTDTGPNGIKNATLDYDYSKNAVRCTAIPGAIAKMYVGGLSPAVQTNITMDVEFSRGNHNSHADLYFGNAWIIIQIYQVVVPDGGGHGLHKTHIILLRPYA